MRCSNVQHRNFWHHAQGVAGVADVFVYARASYLFLVVAMTASVFEGCAISPNTGSDARSQLCLHISLSSNEVHVGNPIVISVCVSNFTRHALVTRTLNSWWQWLVITDKDGREVHATASRIIDPPPDRASSFVVLKPGGSLSRTVRYEWLPAREAATNGLLANESVLMDGALDLQLVPGEYELALLRRVLPDTTLLVDGRLIRPDKYFGVKLASGDLLSNRLSITVLPERREGPEH